MFTLEPLLYDLLEMEIFSVSSVLLPRFPKGLSRNRKVLKFLRVGLKYLSTYTLFFRGSVRLKERVAGFCNLRLRGMFTRSGNQFLL